MQPATHSFRPLTRGDTERLAFRLNRMDLRTREIAQAPLDGATVTATLSAPGKPDLVASTASGATIALARDPTGFLIWTLGSALTRTLADASTLTVRVTDADDETDTWLVATVPARG